MTRNYRQGIRGILSLGPTPTKPRIIKSETDPYEDLFPLDTPVDLTPLATPKVETKVTPKVKKEGSMQRYKKSLRWITRPKPTEQDIQNKEFWEGYNNSEKMVEYINKYGDGDVEVKYDQDGSPDKTTPKQMNDLADRLNQSRQMTGHKKYPVKPSERFNDRIQEQDRKQKAINNKTTKEKTDEQI